MRFRKTVTWRFRRSLRNWGDQRLAELIAGDLPRDELGEDSESLAGSDLGSLRLPSPRGSRLPSPSGFGPGGLSRVSSAPAGTLAMRSTLPVGSPVAGTRSPSSRKSASSPRGSHRSTDLPPIEVPAISPGKWGAEAADRFRLFCTVKNSFGGRCDAFSPTAAVSNIGYRCPLCRREHVLNPLTE